MCLFICRIKSPVALILQLRYKSNCTEIVVICFFNRLLMSLNMHDDLFPVLVTPLSIPFARSSQPAVFLYASWKTMLGHMLECSCRFY